MSDGNEQATSRRRRNLALLALVVVVWVALDQATKAALDGAYSVGDHIAGPFFGLIQFTLVHNTGMAWGLFDDSTAALGVLSVVVCVVVVAYFAVVEPDAGLVEAIGGSFVVAGGIGNAIDRFTLGYVVDFIEPVFIDFPVFNVADIGVTCGFVLFILGFVAREYIAGREEGPQEHEQEPGRAFAAEPLEIPFEGAQAPGEDAAAARAEAPAPEEPEQPHAEPR